MEGVLLDGIEHHRIEQCEPAISWCELLSERSRCGRKGHTDTPANYAQRVTFGPNLQREDFSWIDPGYSQPGGPEDGRVSQHEERSCTTILGRLIRVVSQQPTECSCQNQADPLANSTPIETNTSAETVDGDNSQ